MTESSNYHNGYEDGFYDATTKAEARLAPLREALANKDTAHPHAEAAYLNALDTRILRAARALCAVPEEDAAPWPVRKLVWCADCGVSEVSQEWAAFPCASSGNKHTPSDMPKTRAAPSGLPEEKTP